MAQFNNNSLKLKFQTNIVKNQGHHSNKQNSSKSKLRESKQITCSEFKSKQNDSKHMNGIKPYVIKQRKNSKRDIRGNSSPYQITRSKSRKLETSNRKLEQSVNSKQLGEICNELVSLKNQYKSLKNSYNNLAKEKHQMTSRQEEMKMQYAKQRKKLVQESQKLKKSKESLQNQIDRIKKECFKILESQKFKNKKLEETLQEKQLMISFLRNQNQNLRKGRDMNGSQVQNMDKVFFLQNSAPIFSYESYARLSANNSTMSANNILIENNPITEHKSHQKPKYRKAGQFQQDSLSFSKDKSKQFESVHSLLSNNNDQTIMTFTKKDCVILDDSMSEKKSSEPSSISCGDNEDQCPTFEHRKQERDKKVSFKSDVTIQSKKSKNSRQHTKRLQIMTDDNLIRHQQEDGSCETKKKHSKTSKKKPLTIMKKKK